MTYVLSEGDITKFESIENSNYREAEKYYYLKRVELLNSLLDTIARMKDIKQKELENGRR